MLYLIVIIGATGLIFLGNVLLSLPATPGVIAEYALSSLSAAVAVIAIDGLFAFLIRRLPEKWFAPTVRLFSVSGGERRLYAKLGIKRWKNLVPELGMFTGFHKDSLRESRDAAYLARFLLESNYGVAIHLFNVFDGAFLLLIPFVGIPSIAIPVALVNAVLSFLPVMILRYHTPPLRRLYLHALKAEDK